MRKFVLAVAALLLLPLAADAQSLPNNVQPGYRLIEGEVINGILENLRGRVGGEVALSGTNPTAVVTGLTSISSCVVTIKSLTPTTLTLVSYDTSGGTLNLYAWDSGVASSSTERVGWQCEGVD